MSATEAPETQPQAALQVNMTYEDWVEIATYLTGLAYEIDELKDTIKTLKASDPNESAADAEKHLAHVKEAEELLVKLETEYEVMAENYNKIAVPDDPDDYDYDEGEQFDFGDSAADW